MPLVSPELLFGAQGKQRTVSLIKEIPSSAPDIEPIFTIRPQGKEGLINLRQLFIDMVVPDPSEVEFAEFVFGDLTYWEAMAASPAMEAHVREWRRVADTKRKTQAFKALIQGTKEGNMNAAKYLIEEPWKPRKTPPQKKMQLASTRDAYNNVSSDINRLREEGLLQ